MFVNAYLSLTKREIVSDFTKKSGILAGRRVFQIQFLASRQTDLYKGNLPAGGNCSFSRHFESTTAAPGMFTYAELVQLYETPNLPEALQAKLDRLLTTPYISNAAAEPHSLKPAKRAKA